MTLDTETTATAGAAPEEVKTDAPKEAKRDEEKPKQSELVIQAVSEVADLFHDPKGEAFASVDVGKRREALRLRSRKFRAWCARTVRAQGGFAVGSSAIEEALVVLEGIAVCDREERSTHVRVADHDGALWIDLADEDGRVVQVTREGWSVRDAAPDSVHFVRPGALRPLPLPTKGADASALRPFLNVADDDGFTLALAWLVTAFRPGRPFPVLNLTGEQGTGKSTASRVLRSLVDPSAAPIRSAPRDDGELFVAAVNAHVIAYDNLSGIAPWLSDGLCRLATGGALAKRTLYADADETVLEAIRPIIVNGIDDLAARSDLADRSLLVSLEPIPTSARRDEETFWTDFAAAAPGILGALLDGVSSALANVGRVELASLPRMADFARWATAAEPGLGLPRGSVMAAYRRQRAKAVDVALEASPVAVAVRELLADPKRGGTWEGTAGALLGDLNRIIGDDAKRARGWPKQANHLAGALNRAKTFLREVGVVVGSRTTGSGPTKRRFVVLSTLRNDRAEPSTRSTASAHVPESQRKSAVDDGAMTDPRSTQHRPTGAAAVDAVDGAVDDRPRIDHENHNDSREWVDAVDGVDDFATLSPEGHAFSDLLEETGP